MRRVIILLIILNFLFALMSLATFYDLKKNVSIIDLGFPAVEMNYLTLLFCVAAMFFTTYNIFKIEVHRT